MTRKRWLGCETWGLIKIFREPARQRKENELRGVRDNSILSFTQKERVKWENGGKSKREIETQDDVGFLKFELWESEVTTDERKEGNSRRQPGFSTLNITVLLFNHTVQQCLWLLVFSTIVTICAWTNNFLAVMQMHLPF